MFSPIRIHEIQPKTSDLDQMKVFPFVYLIQSELASYLAKASQLNSDNSNLDLLEWWSVHTGELPHWSTLCRMIQSSSATSERVFSLLNNTFDEQQQGCLEDYVETSIMLQYNTR